MKKKEITIRNSAAEYQTFIAAAGENPSHVELRYEDENYIPTKLFSVSSY